MQVIRWLPVLGHFRLLAVVITIAGLMSPSFPTSGPGEPKPSSSSDLAWVPVETSLDPSLEGEELPAEPVEDEPTEAPEPDEDPANLGESAISLYVAGARRSVVRTAPLPSLSRSRESSAASLHSRSGRGDCALALDLPTRLCRLTC